MTDNMKGAALMTLSMLGFALEDMFLKATAESLPVGLILMVIGAVGGCVFAAIAVAQGAPLWRGDLWRGAVLWRNLTEMGGTVCFVLSIALTPLVTATALFQATPLAVTLGAALFLGAQVGWRRWTAILVGLFGVLLILRPGFDAFNPLSLLSIGAVLLLAARDVVTRLIPRGVPSITLAAYGFWAIVPAGAVMLVWTGGAVVPDLAETGGMLGALVFGLAGYFALISAMRVGDIPVVTPFRYTRLVFGLFIAVLVFGERPDAWTLIGAAIVIATGLFTLWREARVRAA